MSILFETTKTKQGGALARSYTKGFVFSLLLTVAAYLLVDKHLLSTVYLYVAVAGLAFIQAIVHLSCFVRNNTSSEDGQWNMVSFLFTVLVMVVLICGSLWIMYNLNYNMVH